MKTQSLIIGRFQPPTIKHQELIEQMFKTSDTDLIVIGIVQGKKSSSNVLQNPFPQKLRQLMIDKICKEFKQQYNKDYKVIVVNNGYIPDIIKSLEEQDIKVVEFYCGEDRKQGYQKMLDKENLTDVKIVVFNRNMESDENISQTKVRKQLLKGDFEKQKSLIPTVLHDLIPELQEYFQEVVKSVSPRKLQKFLSEIKHIDEIPIEMFINYIRNLLYKSEPMLQSVKLDGIQNITFGYRDGQIYCQRRKGKKQVWNNVDEIPKIPQYNQIRSQFNFFKNWFELNKEIFLKYINEFKDEYFEFEFEILSSLYSNLIKYNLENSKLVYLRPLLSYSSENIDLKQLDNQLLKLFKKFKNKTYDITTTNYIPEFDKDGEIQLVNKDITEKWSFDIVEYINIDKYLDLQRDEIENKLKELEDFLNSKVGEFIDGLEEKYQILTVFEVLTVKLNRVKKEDREILKNLRNILTKIQNEYVSNIKQLLISFINNKVSKEKQGEIEGIVLRKLGVDEDELVKIVDKETFSEINKYVHSYYEELMKEIKDIKTDIITNILKIDDTKNLDVTNLNIDEFIKNLNLNTSDISKIHTKLNEIVNLCNKQIEEVQNSPNIIKVNNKEINVSHLKDKIIKQIMYQLYLVKSILKQDNELFTKKLISYLFNITIEENKQITEGGNQFDGVEKLHYTEVDLQLDELYNKFFKQIKLDKSDFTLLGSVKKKEFSGDLDIGISIDQLKKLYNFNTVDEQLNIVEQLCLKYFEDVRRFNGLISVKFTFNTVTENGELVPKTIQVDFIVGNLNYLKQYFYSQYSPEMKDKFDIKDIEEFEISEYKQVYRNVLLQNILTNQFSEIIQDGDYEYLYQFTVTPQGVWKKVKQRKVGRKTWKVIDKELIDDKDLQKTLSDIFGIQIKFTDISTFEKLLDFMFNKLELDINTIKRILDDLKEFCEKNGYIYPENLINTYLEEMNL